MAVDIFSILLTSLPFIGIAAFLHGFLILEKEAKHKKLLVIDAMIAFVLVVKSLSPRPELDIFWAILGSLVLAALLIAKIHYNRKGVKWSVV